MENPLTQIVNSIIGFLQNGDYIDTTGVALMNTSPQTNNSNQENINCNRIMNKKLIRLTESDLHRIVRMSVNKILRESEYDINSKEYKKQYDLGINYDDQFDKEVSDYEALPDKARHPYGADTPDFSDRLKNRAGLNNIDKLAHKKN